MWERFADTFDLSDSLMNMYILIQDSYANVLCQDIVKTLACLSCSRQSCPKIWFLGPRDHSNLVRIELSSKLPQRLCQNIEYCFKAEPQTFENMNLNAFVNTETLTVGLWETIWGKMSVMTMGSF